VSLSMKDPSAQNEPRPRRDGAWPRQEQPREERRPIDEETSGIRSNITFS
jgi:hypothetical protein